MCSNVLFLIQKAVWSHGGVVLGRDRHHYTFVPSPDGCMHGSGKILILNLLNSSVWKYLKHSEIPKVKHRGISHTGCIRIPAVSPRPSFLLSLRYIQMATYGGRMTEVTPACPPDSRTGDGKLFHKMCILFHGFWSVQMQSQQARSLRDLTLPEHMSSILKKGWYPEGILHMFFQNSGK